MKWRVLVGNQAAAWMIDEERESGRKETGDEEMEGKTRRRRHAGKCCVPLTSFRASTMKASSPGGRSADGAELDGSIGGLFLDVRGGRGIWGGRKKRESARGAETQGRCDGEIRLPKDHKYDYGFE
jgi:hypothetical protein